MESYQFQLLIDTNSIDFAFTRKTIWEELGSGRNAVSCQMFPSGGILLQPSASLPLVRPGWIQWRAFRSRTRLWIYRERPRTHTGTAGPWGSQAWDASLRLRARWLCFCADSLLSACLKSLLATHWTEWQQSNKLLLLYLLLLLLLLYGTGYQTLGFVNAKESLCQWTTFTALVSLRKALNFWLFGFSLLSVGMGLYHQTWQGIHSETSREGLFIVEILEERGHQGPLKSTPRIHMLEEENWFL